MVSFGVYRGCFELFCRLAFSFFLVQLLERDEEEIKVIEIIKERGFCTFNKKGVQDFHLINGFCVDKSFLYLFDGLIYAKCPLFLLEINPDLYKEGRKVQFFKKLRQSQTERVLAKSINVRHLV